MEVCTKTLFWRVREGIFSENPPPASSFPLLSPLFPQDSVQIHVDESAFIENSSAERAFPVHAGLEHVDDQMLDFQRALDIAVQKPCVAVA